jgi:CheY-like chemotaxis protein
MPATPPSFKPARIAFLGFSDFERTALASYFRLAAEREPRFELVYTLTDADYLVADADHGPSVQLVVITERLAETVFIGSPPPPGAAAAMRRPIDALHVMKALDALVLARAGAAPAPGSAHSTVPAPPAAPPVAPSPTLDAEVGVIVQSMLRMPPPAVPPVVTQVVTPAWAPAPEGDRPSAAAPGSVPTPVPGAAPPPFVGPPPPPRALVVDDSDIARRFLTTRLQPWGLRCDTAATSAQAVEWLARCSYQLVFLDVELGPDSELDGLALCRHIQRSALAIDATVVMVSAHHTEVDRARGALAGCDLYLGKPVKEAELATLLRRQRLVPPEGLAARPVLPPAPATAAAAASPAATAPAAGHAEAPPVAVSKAAPV